MGRMESVLDALPQRVRALGWAALFPAEMLVGVVYWGAIVHPDRGPCRRGHHGAGSARRDFNGILAGTPGNIEAQFLSVVPARAISANTDAQGHEILSSEKLPAPHAAVVKACGNSQGVIAGMRSG
jgi:hypothetical protein